MAFVHRRLSIIDLSDDAWQPMSTADGRFHIVFNGEVYNYVELRRQLIGEGHTFVTASDTEVLLEGFARWGTGVLSRVVGMFAFAILDTQSRQVTLARDPFGIKPLFVTRSRGGLAFASEIPALLGLPGVSPTAHRGATYDYLRFGLTDHRPETLFDGIHHLEAGHSMTVAVDRPASSETRPYWECRPGPTPRLTFDEAATNLREQFLTSITLHRRADVEVGTALSGGIDSSSIVAAMRRTGGPELSIRTFSYLSQDPRTDEEAWVDTMVGAAHTTSDKVTLNGTELVEQLDALIVSQGEPFGSTSIAAQRVVFQAAARRGVRVLLDGQGADELFAGYPAYVGARCASLLAGARPLKALRVAQSAGSEPALRVLERAVVALLPRRLREGVSAKVTEPMPQWLDASWFAPPSGTGRLAPSPASAADRGSLVASLTQSLTRTSLPALLRYEDRNSMSVSIESRVPFLTTGMAEWVLSLPEDFIIGDDGTSKRVLRAAMRGLVPDEILDRRDKVGFTTPERDWLIELNPWVESVLEGAAGGGPISLGSAKQDWQAMVDGSRPFDGRAWRWLNLIRWSELFEVDFAR